jgi:hypothetical protein
MDRMLELPDLPGEQKHGEGYATGVSLGHYRGLRTVAHGGADAGFRSMVSWFPDQATGIAVLSNVIDGDPGGHLQKVADILLASEFTESAAEEAEVADAIEIAPERMALFTGSFSVAFGGAMEFQLDDGELFANIVGIGRLPMTPVAEDIFMLSALGVRIRFVEDEGSFDTLEVTLGDTTAGGTRLKPLFLDEAELERFTGRYYSPELMYAVDVAQDDEGLKIAHDRHGDIRLAGERDADSGALPAELAGDRWFCTRVTFETDDTGHITGMRTTGGRVRNLWFEKVTP